MLDVSARSDREIDGLSPSRHPRADPPSLREGLRAWRDFRRDPLELLTRLSRQHGDVASFGVGRVSVVQLCHPDHVQRVLVDNARNYDKKTRGYRALRVLLRDGLVTSEGAFWKKQRRIAQPAFHRQRIAGFGAAMVDLTARMLEQWDDHARRGEAVDLETEMSHLTLRIVAKTLLSADVEDRNHRIFRAVSVLNSFARDFMTNPISPLPPFPTPRNLRYRAFANELDSLVRGIIAERRSGRGGNDLLAMLMDARDVETGDAMSDEHLRDEAMTIFVAGHETTANALTWTFYLLSRHPEVRRRALVELHEAVGDRAVRVDDLPSLPYLHAIVRESMRVFPPVWAIGRRAVADDDIGGYRLRKNTLVLISPWTTQRDPRWWPNPEGFDPERWLGETKARPRYAYFPFGGGARLCIGNNFSIMEAQLVLATVLRRFFPNMVAGHRVELAPMVTLRPKFGMPMTLERTDGP